MSGVVYIVAWDSVFDNVLNIEEQLSSINYKVLNSSSKKVLSNNWENIENIWYFNQFKLALNDFVNSKEEFMCFICGDIEYNNFLEIYNRAEKIFNDQSVGIYAPYFTHEAWGRQITEIDVVADSSLVISTQTDGLMTFISREIAEEMLNLMNYAYGEHPEIETFKSGWGIDYTYCSLALMKKKLIYRDSDFYVTHPVNSNYDYGDAGMEMHTFIKYAKEYCDKNVNSMVSFKDSIDFIDRRRSGVVESLTYLYNRGRKISPVYTNMYIDDKRIESRNQVSRVLSDWTNVNLHTINVSSGDYEKFIKDFPHFSTDRLGGERGNFASHYLRWKYLTESKLSSLLILEDDAELSENFISILDYYIKFLPEDWDVFSLFVASNQFNRCFDDKKVPVTKAYQDWSTLCYIVSKKGAAKMVDYVNNNSADYPTDWFIFRYANERELWNVYTIHPNFQIPVELNQSYDSTVQA